MLVSPAFPDSIGAYERNSDADPDGKQGALDWGTDNRIEVRVETYESKLQQGSTFAVVKISGWSDRMTYEEVLLSFAGIGSPTIIVPGAIQTFDIDGVEITCVATKVPSLSSCQWVGGEDQIILISSSAGVQETLALTGSALTAL